MFKEFDYEDIDVLTFNNIKAAMARMGREVNETEIEQMLKEHRIAKDGYITFDQFKSIVISNKR